MRYSDSFEKVLGSKDRVLVIMAHPDDAEIVCGGTIARLTAEGKQVRLVVITMGEKGTKDKLYEDTKAFAQERLRKQIESGVVLGIPEKEIFNLGIPDGELENTVENIGKVVYHIRQFKPQAIITHNPEDVIIKFFETSHWVNHRDHLTVGLLASFAAYPYSRDTAFFPGQLKAGLTPHTVNELLYADYYMHPEAVAFDVSNHLKQKREALLKHFSAEDVESLISEIKQDNGYFEILRYVKIY